MADWHEELVSYITTVYTKAEELRAKRGYKFLPTSGYPSIAEAIQLVEDGNIAGLPMSSGDDI